MSDLQGKKEPQCVSGGVLYHFDCNADCIKKKNHNKNPHYFRHKQDTLVCILILKHKEGQWSVFTITAYTARRFRGPVFQTGAGEEAGSLQQVTRVTAVLKDCAHREQAPVSVCQISWAVLHHRGSYTTFKKGARVKNTLITRINKCKVYSCGVKEFIYLWISVNLTLPCSMTQLTGIRLSHFPKWQVRNL